MTNATSRRARMVQTYLIDLKVGKEWIEVLIVINIQKKEKLMPL